MPKCSIHIVIYIVIGVMHSQNFPYCSRVYPEMFHIIVTILNCSKSAHVCMPVSLSFSDKFWFVTNFPRDYELQFLVSAEEATWLGEGSDADLSVRVRFFSL